MKVWPYQTIPALPRQYLLALHRDVCALRGPCWGKPLPGLRHVYDHSLAELVHYHFRVMREMIVRGYHPNLRWMDPCYRGTRLQPLGPDWVVWTGRASDYPEHTDGLAQRDALRLWEKIKATPERFTPEDQCRVAEYMAIMGEASTTRPRPRRKKAILRTTARLTRGSCPGDSLNLAGCRC